MGTMRIVVIEVPLDGNGSMPIETVKTVLADAARATTPPAKPAQNPPIVTPHKPRIPTTESKPTTTTDVTQLPLPEDRDSGVGAPPQTAEVAAPAPPRRPPTAPPIGERGMDYAEKAAALLPKEFSSKALCTKMQSLGWTTKATEPIKAVTGVLSRDMRFTFNPKKKKWTFRETPVVSSSAPK